LRIRSIRVFRARVKIQVETLARTRASRFQKSFPGVLSFIFRGSQFLPDGLLLPARRALNLRQINA